MISDIGKALKETKAEVTYVCNIMTQRGETEFSQMRTTWRFSMRT